MNTIVNLAKYGAERYQHIIGPTAAAIPLAIEGGILAKNCITIQDFLKKQKSGSSIIFLKARMKVSNKRQSGFQKMLPSLFRASL